MRYSDAISHISNGEERKRLALAKATVRRWTEAEKVIKAAHADATAVGEDVDIFDASGNRIATVKANRYSGKSAFEINNKLVYAVYSSTDQNNRDLVNTF